ncbi:MAG: CBS domain-containing protein [Aeromonas sp.]
MKSLKAKDYMQTRPITFTAEMMVQTAVEKFLNSHQLGGPVINEGGHLIGWISEQDCIAVMLKESYHCEQVAQVKDVMRKEVLTVGPQTTMWAIAEMMMGAKPKMYPVVEGGVLLGVITRHQVMAAIHNQLASCFVHPTSN